MTTEFSRMHSDILTQIMERKRNSSNFLSQSQALAQADFGTLPPTRDFLAPFTSKGAHIIAEVKRGSPSKGLMNEHLVAADQAKLYAQAGASAISVLTEPHFFFGSIEDLQQAKVAVDLPILRKDFLLETWEIDYSRWIGADAVLLIVACHRPKVLATMLQRARELGLAALVEVHNLVELEIALEIGADLIGINNRNLKTFVVDLHTTEELLQHAPQSISIISESGFHNLNDILRFKDRVHGFLIGEALVTDDNPLNKLAEMTNFHA